MVLISFDDGTSAETHRNIDDGGMHGQHQQQQQAEPALRTITRPYKEVYYHTIGEDRKILFQDGTRQSTMAVPARGTFETEAQKTDTINVDWATDLTDEYLAIRAQIQALQAQIDELKQTPVTLTFDPTDPGNLFFCPSAINPDLEPDDNGNTDIYSGN